MSSKVYTREQVSRHASSDDLWIIIDAAVYDMSHFVDMHPGGAFPILEFAGKDATEAFYGLHRQEVLVKYQRYKIGTVDGEKPQIEIRQPGSLSKVPYAEASAWMGFKSAYFSESHLKFRTDLRALMDAFGPEIREIDMSGERPPDELVQRLGSLGILAANVGPGAYLTKYNVKLPCGIPPEKFDYFHELIMHEEVIRWGARGADDGIFAGMIITLPTVINYGSPALQDKIIPEVLAGRKRMALAITEPYVGSDVASLRTTAKKTPDGKYFIVNGVKKWITSGRWADYFSVAVRTDKGISMLLIERCEGLETKQIKTSYSASAGTAYVTFDNVKVPVENLLGEENKGFQVIMSNFNHERWMITACAIPTARLAVEDCFKWAMQRKVFNKRLVEQPVIRNKLASMIAKVESAQNWLENLTYQMNHMSYKEQSDKLAGPIALCKYYSTRMVHDISDEACQIFGGRAITQTGMGRYIEALQRTYKVFSIPGGSEEIMADLGVRQAMKKFPNNARL
ncbi:acyl-CoA dehydrogenase/oxidase [Dichotomocladium elegans]|nr:acyl-CoA dehydrogenase/oxidase [Dichotomocladium elegans]